MAKLVITVKGKAATIAHIIRAGAFPEGKGVGKDGLEFEGKISDNCYECVFSGDQAIIDKNYKEMYKTYNTVRTKVALKLAGVAMGLIKEDDVCGNGKLE